MARRIPILYEDEHLLVVDKPAHTLVVQAPGRTALTVLDLLRRQTGGPVFPVHRLDEDTTGVLVLARSVEARRALDELFRGHRAERVYLALVRRTPSPPAGRIESRLEEGPDGIVRSVSGKAGRRAVTEYRSLGRRGPYTLVECRLDTGRRNQIRVHMADIGCPIVGDRKYGFRPAGRPGEPAPKGGRRPLLHALRIRFDHPITQARVAVEAEPPEPELRS